MFIAQDGLDGMVDVWSGALSRRLRGYGAPGCPVAPHSLHTFNVEGSGVLGRGIRAHTHTHTPPAHTCAHRCTHTHTQRRAGTHYVPSPALQPGAPPGSSVCLRPNADYGGLRLRLPRQPRGWAGGQRVRRATVPQTPPPTYLQSWTVTPRPGSVGGEAGTRAGAGAGQRAESPGEVSCGCTHTGMYSGHKYHIQR